MADLPGYPRLFIDEANLLLSQHPDRKDGDRFFLVPEGGAYAAGYSWDGPNASSRPLFFATLAHVAEVNLKNRGVTGDLPRDR